MLAEGKITEPKYLRSLKGSEIQLEFGDTDGFTPMALVRQARRDARANRRTGDFDEMWRVAASGSTRRGEPYSMDRRHWRE